MTNKVQKIREEVERLFNHVKDSDFESDSGAFYYLKDLLDFIDSLQEEPVSIWHDANEKPNIKDKGSVFVITSLNGEYIGSRYYNRNDITINFGNYDKWAYLNDLVNLSNVQRTGKDWKEETISKELEIAAKKYADDENPTCPCEECLIKTFKAGAEWAERKKPK